MYPKPSAPPFDLLKDDEAVDLLARVADYNCEDGCDVEFLVGKYNEDFIRIPVHTHKLTEYPVFKAMLSEEFSSNESRCFCTGHDTQTGKLRQIRVEADSKAFDNLMKFVYMKPVNLHQATVEVIVETLKVAHQFLLAGLVRTCVEHLNKLISLGNVLFVFANVRLLCNDLEKLEELTADIHKCQLPLPPPSTTSKKRKRTSHGTNNAVPTVVDNPGLEIKGLCVWLLCQSLAFIDIHAAHVLESDEMEELDSSYVKLLLKRDSLDVSEMAVFSALIRWAETECKRRHLPLTPESKRLVLHDHDLIYTVRYLQMTVCDFLNGPAVSGLLSQGEVGLFRNILVQRGGGPTTNATFKTNSNHHHHYYPQDKNLQAIVTHWKYLCQPRSPRLNNGDFTMNGAKGSWSSYNNGHGHKRARRKSSLLGAGGESAKKGIIKFKKIGFLVKSFCIPCAFHKKTGNAQNSDSITITNNLQSLHATQLCVSSQQNNAEKDTNSSGESQTCKLKRNDTKISKVLDFSLRAFAFFFD